MQRHLFSSNASKKKWRACFLSCPKPPKGVSHGSWDRTASVCKPKMSWPAARIPGAPCSCPCCCCQQKSWRLVQGHFLSYFSQQIRSWSEDVISSTLLVKFATRVQGNHGISDSEDLGPALRGSIGVKRSVPMTGDHDIVPAFENIPRPCHTTNSLDECQVSFDIVQGGQQRHLHSTFAFLNPETLVLPDN